MVAEPGTRYIYSDHALRPSAKSDVSGQPSTATFASIEPLGMSDTDLLRSEAVKTRLATGSS